MRLTKVPGGDWELDSEVTGTQGTLPTPFTYSPEGGPGLDQDKES